MINRPGAGTNIGAASVASSEPDGYTMLLNAPASFVINQFIYNSLPYDPDTAFAPACLAAQFPNVLVVHPSLGAKTIQELIDKAKASPGKIEYAIAGIGATSHLSGALFAEMAGIDIVAIPYKGTSQSLPDLVSRPRGVHDRQSRPDSAVHKLRASSSRSAFQRKSRYRCCRAFRRSLPCSRVTS